MMSACYFELRKSIRGENSITADVMRHLHTRQHLGKAVIICDDPISTLSAARKKWLKLSRSLQKQRSSTLNADKILKYTHAVTRMQRMHFSTKSPLERPEADVYFLERGITGTMPVHCWTIYLTAPVDQIQATNLIDQMPADSLIVDYDQTLDWPTLGVLPKDELEAKVSNSWQQVQGFLHSHQIDVTRLIIGSPHDVEAMDDALDTLLGGHAHEFLQKANEFQRSLELARPLRLSKTVRASYDSLILLAHRVQALSPGDFSRSFLEVYNEDDTFFLYDVAQKLHARDTEALTEAFARHTNAGRHNLARSLQSLAELN